MKYPRFIGTYTMGHFKRLKGPVYAVVSIDGDTSEYVKVVKADLIAVLSSRGEQGVQLARDADGWLYLGVHYPEAAEGTVTP